MTFYPIDKPTEPGWYWFRISSQLAQPFPLKVTIEEGELWGHSVMPPSPGTPFKAHVEKFVGQWYGPKIEPPNPHAHTVGVNDVPKKMDDVPRRFRWIHDSMGLCGEGWLVSGQYVLDGSPNCHSVTIRPGGCIRIEWLDPEPER